VKRVFRLESGDWVYSDGKRFMVKVKCDDKIRLEEPTKEEAEEILEKLHMYYDKV